MLALRPGRVKGLPAKIGYFFLSTTSLHADRMSHGKPGVGLMQLVPGVALACLNPTVSIARDTPKLGIG